MGSCSVVTISSCLPIVTCCELFIKDVRLFVVFRALTGLFDCQTPLFQASFLSPSFSTRCMGDVTVSEKRAYYLSQLEAVNNVSQAVGPFIGALLCAYSLSAALLR